MTVLGQLLPVVENITPFMVCFAFFSLICPVFLPIAQISRVMCILARQFTLKNIFAFMFLVDANLFIKPTPILNSLKINSEAPQMF